MHPIIHTEAFVLKSLESGEANKRVWLFTKDFGLIVATAQGVRKGTAKLKSHIIDYCYINVDLVKGRDVWRLISAQVLENPFVGSYDKLRARSYIRALSLVERFCVEEGSEIELFNHLTNVLKTLGKASENPNLFDTIVLWKILVLLGYLELSPDSEKLFYIDLEDISSISEGISKGLIKEVTDAINRTHL
jgi:DNA repair protein RecO